MNNPKNKIWEDVNIYADDWQTIKEKIDDLLEYRSKEGVIDEASDDENYE